MWDLDYFTTKVPDKSNTSETRMTRALHECDTSAASATHVQLT